ncbi:hypothetical protein ANCDUO_02074 [Ancylostoma duodenale]|uniref:Tc1-like transposase DDE domain-containing protein n=1 Tax=Ancylostoma duodenale TaxID=51022 RepID=A0A0C2DCK5_9BILA|nr:hypothetical protein ANCDUO_02074 [Ancylostoma duodenale]
MQSFANGRQVTFVMDNAPYHSRVIERVSLRCIFKAEAASVHAAATPWKRFVQSMEEPPYHCFFNPIELCWSQLKHHLSRLGKPSDKIEIVKDEHWNVWKICQQNCVKGDVAKAGAKRTP